MVNNSEHDDAGLAESSAPLAPNQPTISIIIPLYNYSEVVPRAISSVIDQITPACELIVINDGSTDGSHEVVLHMREQSDFAYYNKPNEGLAATRNFGIDHSRGKYIVFLDADDYLCPGAVDIFLKEIHIQAHPILVFAHESIYPNGTKKYHPPPSEYISRHDAFLDYGKKVYSLSSGSVVFSRDVFGKIRFPENLLHAEDQPVYALLVANNGFSVNNFPTCAVVKHDFSMRKNADAAIAADVEMVDFIFRHPSFPKEFSQYYSIFLSGRLLSLFRTLYKAERYRASLRAYSKALKIAPKNILIARYFRKALVAVAKILSGKK